jgi:hypothetical protein
VYTQRVEGDKFGSRRTKKENPVLIEGYGKALALSKKKVRPKFSPGVGAIEGRKKKLSQKPLLLNAFPESLPLGLGCCVFVGGKDRPHTSSSLRGKPEIFPSQVVSPDTYPTSSPPEKNINKNPISEW